MPKTRITVASIEKLKRDIAAGAARVEISDAEARGLVLRAGPAGLIWQLRFEMNGRSSRLTLGAVDEWSIAEARLLVGDARKLIAGKIRRPDDEWVQERRVEYGKVEAPRSAAEDPRQSIYWTFAQARDHYLQHIKATRSQETYRDYRQKLESSDLRHLEKRPIPSITRKEISKLLADVHATGRESTAEGLARTIKPFFNWMAEDNQIDSSGAQIDVMRRLKAPERSRDEDAEDLDTSLYVPPMHEVGRIIAIARSGALDPIVGLAIELMCFVPQRRLAISRALSSKVVRRGNADEGLWSVPPAHRKTAIKRGIKADLVIPLAEPAWTAVQKAKALGEADDHRRLFFRRATPRSTDKTSDHIDPGTLTKTLATMPGVQASPHDLRRAFATHGQSVLGFSLYQRLFFFHRFYAGTTSPAYTE